MVHKKDKENKEEQKEDIPQEESFENGPFALLTKSVINNEEVLLSLRNNRKMVGRVKAFDRHMNLILEDICEKWLERPKGNKGQKAKGIVRERFFKKIFVRGDGIILIVKKPN